MAPTNKQVGSSISTSKQQQPAQALISQMSSQSQYQQKPNELASNPIRNMIKSEPSSTFSNQMGSHSSSTANVNRNKH